MLFDVNDRYLLTMFKLASDKGIDLGRYVSGLFDQIGQMLIDKKLNISNKKKIGFSKFVIKKAFEVYGARNMVVAWTGGKDSTLVVWLIKQVVEENGYEMPRCLFIDEGSVFPAIESFVSKLMREWGLKVDRVKNEDVLRYVRRVGGEVLVDRLNERNKRELERLGFKKDKFYFYPESYIGNHLMKTVVMNRYLEENSIKVVITGIRWDEQKARSNETYFSHREDSFTPSHERVHPILHFTEKDVWRVTLDFNIPYCSLYKDGFRSLGARESTHKMDDCPAWEQDLENTNERSGRNQDKEEIMQKLRDLGYM